MKEVVLQATIDWLYPVNPQLLDRIFGGRPYEKKQIIMDKEENDITYYLIKDE
jgi:hypothetical protein